MDYSAWAANPAFDIIIIRENKKSKDSQKMA